KRGDERPSGAPHGYTDPHQRAENRPAISFFFVDVAGGPLSATIPCQTERTRGSTFANTTVVPEPRTTRVARETAFAVTRTAPAERSAWPGFSLCPALSIDSHR